MEWVLAGLVVVVMAAAAVVGTGRWGSMPPAVDDRPPGRIPAGPLGADDLRRARFSVVPRGYSMAQVDALLARLAEQMDADRPATHPDPASEAPGARAPEIGSGSQHLE